MGSPNRGWLNSSREGIVYSWNEIEIILARMSMHAGYWLDNLCSMGLWMGCWLDGLYSGHMWVGSWLDNLWSRCLCVCRLLKEQPLLQIIFIHPMWLCTRLCCNIPVHAYKPSTGWPLLQVPEGTHDAMCPDLIWSIWFTLSQGSATVIQ